MTEATVDSNSTLIALRFDHSLKAQECLLAMLRIAEAETIRIEDAAIVDKDDNGRIRLRQSKDISPGQGATAGTFYGSLFGLIGGPVGMLAGGALGAAAGGLWGKLRDIGVNDDHMRDMGDRINPGENLLFLLLERINQDAFVREMRRFDATLFESTAPDALDARVEEALAAKI